MKRLLKYLLIFTVLAIIWTITVFFSTLNGWWYKPFTQSTEANSFTEAVSKKVDIDFAGNFAMAILKDGKVEKDYYYSINKPVDRNTIFQVSSLSKVVSTVGVMKLVKWER